MKIDRRDNKHIPVDASRASSGSARSSVRGYGMRGAEGMVPPVAPGQAVPPQGAQYQYAPQHAAPQYGQPQGAPVYYQPVYVEAPKKKRRVGLVIAIIVALVCVALAGALAYSMLGLGKSARQGDAGQLDGKSPEEIQAELDRVVEEGMFNISIASVAQFANGSSPGELRIENVPGNRYLMRVEIMRDDTGEMIYTTDYIEPNHHVQTDKLDVVLPEGSYPSTATFFAYDPDTEELVGQAAAKVTIEVLS